MFSEGLEGFFLCLIFSVKGELRVLLIIIAPSENSRPCEVSKLMKELKRNI